MMSWTVSPGRSTFALSRHALTGSFPTGRSLLVASSTATTTTTSATATAIETSQRQFVSSTNGLRHGLGRRYGNGWHGHANSILATPTVSGVVTMRSLHISAPSPPLVHLSLSRPHRCNRVLSGTAATVTSPSSTSRRFYSPHHFYQNRVLDPYVQQAVNPITLRQLVFFGRNMQEDKLLKSANYVRQELPVRLAHRIRDFQNLPFIVGTNPHIELVYDLYWQAFDKVSKIPEIKTLEENDQFCGLVKGLLNDHLVVIPQLALGIMECSKHIPPEQVDKFMNKMLRSRISRRVLAEQHISLTSNFNSPNHMVSDRGYIGIIYTHCNPRDIVERTAILAAETCRQSTGGMMEPPKVIMDGSIDAEFSYIPDHIEYILYELLKNSMRFVMRRGARSKAEGGSGELPPIQVTVCEGDNEIVFRVSDKGGGIDPEMESHLWSYAQSPARFANFEKISKMAATVQEQMVSPSRSVNSAPMASMLAGRAERGDTADHYAADLENIKSQGSEVELPPPPPESVRNKRQGSMFGAGETTLLLDKHAPPRSLSGSWTSAVSASADATAVIDPSQVKTPLKKKGHLDCESRHRAAAEVAAATRGGSSEPLEDQAMHLGIGLPMSRVYAEYWGGDLQVFTMHGYGTDAYAKFCKFGNIYENFDV